MTSLANLTCAVRELAVGGALKHPLAEVQEGGDIGEMARAIVALEGALRSKEAELSRALEEFQTLFDFVPCSISVQDRQYRLL